MKIIKALVLRVDNFTFVECPATKDINCDGATVIGMAWMVPLTNMGVVREYQSSLESVKPTVDSIRVIIVETAKPEIHQYYICVADDAGTSVFTDMCNTCCGSTPSAPAYVPPQPIVEDCGCADSDGNYTYYFPMPVNPNALLIFMYGSVNGSYITPAPPSTFANNAAILTWLLANATAYGTWTLTSGVLKLVSTTSKCVGLRFDLVAAAYCYPYLSTVQTADALIVQTSATGPTTISSPFPGGQISFSSSNPGPLQLMLNRLMNGTFAINPGPLNKLNYVGLQVPVKLQLAGVDVTSGAFTSGTCLNVFNFAIPVNPSGYNYFITTNLFNGVDGVPVPDPLGWTTTGAMLTWLNTNWSAYGVWTIVGSNVVLTGAGTYSASMTIVVHA